MQTSSLATFPLFAGLSEADRLQQLPHRLLDRDLSLWTRFTGALPRLPLEPPTPGNPQLDNPLGVVTVRRLIMLLVLMAVLAPMAASAGTGSTSARTDCAKLRAAMGATAFSQAYATFGACVSRYAPIEQQVTSSANVTCTAQQADP